MAFRRWHAFVGRRKLKRRAKVQRGEKYVSAFVLREQGLRRSLPEFGATLLCLPVFDKPQDLVSGNRLAEKVRQQTAQRRESFDAKFLIRQRDCCVFALDQLIDFEKNWSYNLKRDLPD